jgi:hypothetical protein
MRTSLIELQQTEQYLQGAMGAGDRLVFEARLLTNPILKMNMRFQQQAYKLLRLFHLKEVKREVAEVQQQLFTADEHAAFRREVQSLFK